MKNMLKLFSGILAIAAIVTLFSCQGPPGVAGTDGADGADGTNGTSGNVTCMTCHDESTDYAVKRTQFNESAHSLGTYYDRGGECSGCHSTEGFLARESFTAASDIYDLAIPEQTAISCKTCHKVHQDYAATDWDLTIASVVTETLYGTKSPEVASIAFGDLGNSNQCLQCHQARDRGNVPSNTSTADVETSSHWGPHYGVQGNVLFSNAGVNVGTGYPTDPHFHGKIENACVACHMHEDNHSLAVNLESCAGCHTSADNAEEKLVELETAVHTKLMELGAALATKGVMTEVTNELDEIIGYAPIGGTISADDARLVYNFMVVEEDGSAGMHNPSYIMKLLTNSIAAAK
jgi:hypothetical protein